MANNIPTPFNTQEDLDQFLLNEVLKLGKGRTLALTNKPTASNSTGTAGQVAYDTSYLYICVAKNTWKRISLTW